MTDTKGANDVANDGIENLIPVRTEEEAREKGRKGGIASGKARREKRDRKQRMAELLDLNMQGAGVDKIKKFFGLKDDLTAYETICLSCLMKAMQKGDANALEKLLKISGEQFAEVLDVSVGKSEKLADIMDQLKND